ncbi:MAG: ribbon-helix-helix protein, CopG family [Actinomycetota bacterium]|nr:ribbon-helix-helix protein, CopG family [Actinomycetota bacterium]
MYEKVTISIPAELLEEVDDLAGEVGTSRSGLIREATARYLADRERAMADLRRREGAKRALEHFAELRESPGLDDRPSLEILREIRERHG